MRTLSGGLAVALMMSLVLVQAGCGGSSSAQADGAPQQDAAVQDDAGPVCATTVGAPSAACGECRDESCCTAALACEAEASCKTWAECIALCTPTDVDCARACWEAAPAGDEQIGLMTCMATNCDTACEMPPCGGWNYLVPECGTCSQASCCDETTACAEDVECQGFIACVTGCPAGDTTCIIGCYADHQDGAYINAESTACRIASCTEDCGITGCGGLGFTAPACNTCAQSACCSQLTACGEDAECHKYLACVWGCGSDQTCLSTCQTTQWQGAGLSLVSDYCIYTECSTECSAELTSACGLFAPPDETCRTCMDASCCELNDACSQSADCLAVSSCVSGCADDDPECWPNCYENASDEGFALFISFQVACIGTNCQAECGYPEDFACGGLGFEDETCNTCLRTSCCDEAEAVALDPAAATIEVCVERCELDAACETACKTGADAIPLGMVELFRSCVDTNCGSSCWVPPESDGGV